VSLGSLGEIIIDEGLETNRSGIFAAGDVIGRRIAVLPRPSSRGAVAAENAIGGSRTIDERFVPRRNLHPAGNRHGRADRG
jgi:pyruvate/2-oxoglutarate dehydrogenase complex dihydrolipoamide dehydrogenase (E3) component